MAASDGVLCGSAAAVLYLIGLYSEETAGYYKSVTPVNQLEDLGKLLKTANKVLVKISGKVSSDTPINCKLSGLRGVIVEERAYQNFLKQNDEGKWIRDETSRLSTIKEVPWYLMLRVTRIERVLPTGIQLSIVGEVIKNDNGTFTIHQPGSVCHGNISLDQFIEYYRSSAWVGDAAAKRKITDNAELSIMKRN